MIITHHHLGRVEYADGLELQRAFQAARRAGTVHDTLLMLEHPPVLTLGRGAKAAHIIAPKSVLEALGVSVFETDRGGDVTYHGPGQLVGYPLLYLPPHQQDVRKYVRNLEEVIIRTLADFSLTATRIEQWPGVWVERSRTGGPRKICALGVHLSRWYTRHGFALNVQPNLAHFELIVPCGISEAGVTSMAAELQRQVDLDEVEARIALHFGQVFEASIERAPPPVRTIALAVLREDSEVLVLKRTADRGGFWQIITGAVNPDETVDRAATRELYEETGAQRSPVALGYVHTFVQESLVVTEESGFAVRVPNQQAIRLSAEHEMLEWVTQQAALQRLPFEGLREVVRRATRHFES